MQLSGTEYLESLRDGRVLYLGSERVEDVTSHPAFRNAAGTFAKIQDALRDPANRDMLTYEEDGARHAFYWLKPRSREDLVWRWRAHRYVADLTYGMIGRTQDFYAGFVTALAMQPEALDNRVAQVRRERGGLLRASQGQRPLHLQRGHAAARYPPARILRCPRQDPAGASRSEGGRHGRHGDQRQALGDRRALRPRGLASAISRSSRPSTKRKRSPATSRSIRRGSVSGRGPRSRRVP